MKILRSVYNQIRHTIGSARPEQGGILLSSDGGDTITKFIWDKRGSCTGGSYSPDTAFINEQIKLYNNKGYYFIGCIHSHPRGYDTLSMGVGHGGYGHTASDEEAIYKLMAGMKGTRILHFPVVQSSNSGQFSIRWFYAVKDRNDKVTIYEDKLWVVEDDHSLSTKKEIGSYLSTSQFSSETAILIAAGNTTQVALQLARRGINQFIVIDGTRFTADDLASMATYADIGGYKADALARQIHAINPTAKVKIIRQYIDEEVDNSKFQCWIENISRRKSIVIFCEPTIDNFEHTQKLCAAAHIALIRAYSKPTTASDYSVVYTEYYDYWSLARVVPKFHVEYVKLFGGLQSPTNLVLYQQVNHFFTNPIAKQERQKAARSVEQTNPTVDKFEPLYTRDEIASKHVVVIGCGGSMSYIENLVRSGISHLTLIDGDTYSQTNVQTQMAYMNDMGRFKVDVAISRITLINPDVKVTAVKKMLDENMSDEEFVEHLGKEWLDRPNDVLIAACTDNFIAQARCARLALKYGFPYIQAGIYPGGRILELAFFHPLVSTVCPRCMLSGRYKANLERKVKPEPAKSNGTSIFFTEQLNSLKGFISLALLLYHSETADKRFSEFMDDNGWATPKRTRKIDRNYMFFTMDSKLAEHTGRKAYITFDKWGQKMGSNYQIGVSFFRKRKPEKHCPDCGGKGKPLIHVKGKITDTRDGLYVQEEQE